MYEKDNNISSEKLTRRALLKKIKDVTVATALVPTTTYLRPLIISGDGSNQGISTAVKPEVQPANNDEDIDITFLEKKYGIKIGKPGEKHVVQDMASRAMFDIFDMEPTVESKPITPAELTLLDRAFSRVPYVGRLINDFVVADNLFPAEGPFADVGKGNNWFQGLFEPIHGKGKMYIFRPQCINFSPIPNVCSLEATFPIPSKTLYGAHLDSISFGEMYEAIILHELGHAVENVGLSVANPDLESYNQNIQDYNRMIGFNNPIMSGFLKSWGTSKPSEQDLINYFGRKVTRGPITYSMLTHEIAKIEGDGWKYTAAMDCPVPHYLARFAAVPPEDLSTFPIRTLFGPTTESWADFWMMHHLGQPFTPNTDNLKQYIENIDNAFRTKQEAELMSRVNEDNNIL